MKVLVAVFVLFIAFFLAGCGGPSEAEKQAAEKAEKEKQAHERAVRTAEWLKGWGQSSKEEERDRQVPVYVPVYRDREVPVYRDRIIERQVPAPRQLTPHKCFLCNGTGRAGGSSMDCQACGGTGIEMK